MENFHYILRYNTNNDVKEIADNYSKYSKNEKKFKRYGTINGFNFKEANINKILENLDNLDCENDNSKELLKQIELMDDNDYEKLIKTIKLENSKLKENIYLNNLLYHPNKITHKCMPLNSNISNEDKQLFMYKKLLEEQEIILRKENMILNQQLQSIEKFKNLKSSVGELNNSPINQN